MNTDSNNRSLIRKQKKQTCTHNMELISNKQSYACDLGKLLPLRSNNFWRLK